MNLALEAESHKQSPEAKRVFVDSANINCRPNSILSSRLYIYLQRNNCVVVSEMLHADYVICNTCGFNLTFQHVSEKLFSKYSRSVRRDATVIAVGCLNSIKDDLSARFPNVMFVRSLDELDEIFFSSVRFRDVQEAYLRQEDWSKLSTGKRRGFGFADKLHLGVGRALAALLRKKQNGGNLDLRLALDEVQTDNKFFVEIGSGCTGNCSYCVIKKAKGAVKSRPVDLILRDIETALEPGKSLCLVADDCGSYGVDTGVSLVDLVSTISGQYPSLGIELSYVNPKWVEENTDAFLKMCANTKIVSINIPIQSGSNRIIKLMNRSYSPEKIAVIVRKLKTVSPNTLIWTHVLVGFPGETSGDFRKTLAIVESFDLWYNFTYSESGNTSAARLPGKVPEWIKKTRALRLRIKGIKRHISRTTKLIFFT